MELSPIKIIPPPSINQTPNSAYQAKTTDTTASPKVIDGEYIIIFENQFSGRINQTVAQQANQLTNEVISSLNLSKSDVLSRYKYAIKGFAAKLSGSRVTALKRDPRIKSVTPNLLFKLNYGSGTYNKNDISVDNLSSSSQTTPWGVNRVNGPLDGTGQTAWILDTGVDLDHPDLSVSSSESVSFIDNESADDQVGHGTHVAGILAAKDNSQNIVGVAAGAAVVAVKVCNSLPPSDPGSGCPADAIIDGVDYVSNNAQSSDIVNMSLGGSAYSPIDNAIINAANVGIRFVIAAGNESQDANNVTPARVEHSNVWTVSGYDINDDWYQNSNYGNPPIEYGGPGVDVLSLWKNGGTNTISGTSMATPHIAGLLLASDYGIDTDGTVSGDPDSNADPIAVAAADLPLKVTIGGPRTLNAGQTGYFNAHVSNAEGPVSVQWYYRNSPGDSWKTGGTTADYQHTWNKADSDAAVKVEVNSAGESDSDIHDVYITCPSGPTVNSTDPEDIDPC